MVDKQKDFRTVKVHHARAQAPAVVENDNGVVQVGEQVLSEVRVERQLVDRAGQVQPQCADGPLRRAVEARLRGCVE